MMNEVFSRFPPFHLDSVLMTDVSDLDSAVIWTAAVDVDDGHDFHRC